MEILGFALRNTPEEIAELSDQWKTALKQFQTLYTHRYRIRRK